MPKLSERAVSGAKPRDKVYRLSDGDGLLMQVKPGGGKAWIFRFQIAGRRRDMGLGSYPEIGLAQARRLAQDAARLVEAGRDPVEAQREAAQAAASAAEQAAVAGTRTFRAVAETLVATQSPGWSSDKTLASWRLTLDKHAYPTLGDRPIDKVDRDDVVGALTPVWSAQPATAKKLQRRIASVLDYAAALGWRSTDNPATGRVLRITKALPKAPPAKKQPSLPWRRVPAFLATLDGMEGLGPIALRFGILTAVRSAELRLGAWNELDLVARIWTIPAARMKGGRAKEMEAHRVPLSAAAVAVLEVLADMVEGQPVIGADLARYASRQGDALLFPAPKGGALSDATLGACIKRMNEAAAEAGLPLWTDVDGRQAVPHGFRRSFRSWVDDTRPAEGEAAEKALAHEDSNQVRAAYRGSDMLEQRRPLMEAWGEFCRGPRGSA
ncbi:MAG TPA: integrase arm-type DNA-binding domain-containing protein [Roseomonas sp.]|jgi:integrase